MHRRPLEGSLRNRIRQLQAQQSGTLKTSSPLSYTARRFRSTTASHDVPVAPGFIFDIDGVLKIGEKVLPQGQKVGS